MGKEDVATLTPEAVADYLRERVDPDARVVSMSPLGASTQAGLKAYGYGRPLRVVFEVAGARRDLVIRTMSPDPFGHDRRADRAAVLLDAFDTFDRVPRHIAPVDVGAFAPDGRLVPMAPGEIYLVTTYAPGELYANDLQVASSRDDAGPRDLARACVLADYLAELHAEAAPAQAHVRDVRDTVGSGEGIFGLCDSYPADDPVAPPARLQRIEELAVGWRWRLRAYRHRARRTHGDFHPFNLLFDGHADLAVLDASRGGAGEPADDVACLGLNYLFFALRAHGRFVGAARALWDAFWGRYLERTGDRELLEVVAPFFAWRGLVVASPVWYPDVPVATREVLFGFVERLLAGAPFDPAGVDELL